MASISVVNAKADLLRKNVALAANCNAAKGLQDVVRSNLGPKGTMKMLVGGAGQVKVTKDGNVLLHEMQIQHPTAAMIARASTAQDTITGDGTTSTVLFIGELMKLSERYIWEGVHPRQLCDGFDLARKETLKVLETVKVARENIDKELLTCVARTSLRTKLPFALADQLTQVVVDACLCIKSDEEPLDLFMIEVLHMKQRLVNDSRLVRGVVMDHGPRHPDMPRSLKNCYILTSNVSLEYEKTEVNSGFFYSNAEQREKLVEAERRFTDEKVKKIIRLKQRVCTPENGRSFVVLNQKGIDPPSLDMLAKEGIFALRRVKRRNMERITLACGGNAVNSVEDLEEADLGYAEEVHEEQIGDDKWTFVEGVKDPKACTVLVKGPNEHSINQIKDALRDGFRAVKNTLEDRSVVPGAGAFEVAAYDHLMNYARESVSGKTKLGVQAFGEAMLIIPKVLAENAGFDMQDSILKLVEARQKSKKMMGLCLDSGEPIEPELHGIWDNYRVKRQMLSIAPTLAQQLLLVDEIIRAGKQMGGNN